MNTGRLELSGALVLTELVKKTKMALARQSSTTVGWRNYIMVRWLA